MPTFFDLLKYAKTGLASPDMTAYDKAKALAMCGGGLSPYTIIGQPPISFKSDGTPLTSVTIKGNGQQNGTPSPQNIVPFDGTGERTGNLFDASLLQNNMHLDNTTGLPVSYTDRIAAPNPVDVSQYSTVAIGYVSSSSIKMMYAIFSNGELVERVTAISSGTAIDVSSADSMYICFYSIYGVNINTSNVSDIMLNAGSTALPYEPFGYKIPLTCAGQTTPLYLGEVSTVRRIKKLVLDGTEEWQIYTQVSNTYRVSISDTQSIGNPALCSHFENTPISTISSGKFTVGSTWIYIRYADVTDITDFKSFLAAQYANGTPVTVWYVITTPKTGIVNEPLMRIGDYCDELTTTTPIPTAKGSNTLSVDTTVQPSEVSITGNIKPTT